jgi:hypothetical protein
MFQRQSQSEFKHENVLGKRSKHQCGAMSNDPDYKFSNGLGKSKKRQYMIVSQDKRDHLIDLVTNHSITIKRASVLLGINYSTAKHIYK